MLFDCLVVAVGGAIGATGRFLMGKINFGIIGFPINTFVINIIGCFVIGLVIGAAQKGGVSARTALFMKTGICGGFSTLAAFSAETLAMLEHGRIGVALVYVVSTVIICVLGTWLGTIIGKTFA